MTGKEHQEGASPDKTSSARQAIGAGIRASENISALVTALAPHLVGVLFHILPHAPQLTLRFFKILSDAADKAKANDDEEPEPR